MEYIKNLLAEGKIVDLVLTDYHMDVVNKSHEADIHWGKNNTPQILDGKVLTQKILEIKSDQKVVIVSGASMGNIMEETKDSGARAVLYKRKPDDKKFGDYIRAIDEVIETGRLSEGLKHILFHRRMAGVREALR